MRRALPPPPAGCGGPSAASGLLLVPLLVLLGGVLLLLFLRRRPALRRRRLGRADPGRARPDHRVRLVEPGVGGTRPVAPVEVHPERAGVLVPERVVVAQLAGT